ncbi:MAG: hemolysin family protein [Nitrososphaerales archaeon]
MVDITFSIAALVGIVVASAFFSGLEVAFISINKGQIKKFLNDKRRGAASLQKLKSNPSRMLTTLLIGNNLANVAAAAVATDLAITVFQDYGLGIATGIMTFLLLVFGEITPKAYCNAHAETISLRFAGPIRILEYAIFPIVRMFEGITKGIFRLIGTRERPPPISEEEVKAFLDVGVEEKVLLKEEKKLIEEVLEFHDIPARAVMTPRKNMVVFNARMLLWEALPMINKGGYSRVPIMEGTKDNIVGIVHNRDLLRSLEIKSMDRMLKDIARKPLFVSQEKKISDLLKEFQSRRIHIAIVVDEFGGTEGLVTLEDIIEELVGEIVDETDIERQLITTVDKNTIIVHGDVEIDDVNEALNVHISKGEDYSTLNGLLHARLHDIPKHGDKISLDNVIISVEEVKQNAPLKIKVQRVQADYIEDKSPLEQN